MSQGGVSERIGFLRARIAAIEAGARRAAACVPARADPFDALLARGALCEALPARAPDAPATAAFALALALRALALRRGALVWIVEERGAGEYGLPYGRGLMAAGVDLARLALVRARNPGEALWALEEALRSPACAAAVAESFIPARRYGLAESRRLLLAARRGGGLGLLLAQGAAGEAARFSSAADMRVEIAAAPPAGPHLAIAPAAPFRWRLRLVKARAGLTPGAIDPARWRDLAFDPESTVFRDAFSECVPAAPGDGPAAADVWRASA